MTDICKACLYSTVDGSREPCLSCFSKMACDGQAHPGFEPLIKGEIEQTVCYADNVPVHHLTANEYRKQNGLEPLGGINKDSASYKAGYSDGRQSVLDELGIQAYQYEFLKVAFAKVREEKNDGQT